MKPCFDSTKFRFISEKVTKKMPFILKYNLLILETCEASSQAVMSEHKPEPNTTLLTKYQTASGDSDKKG